MVGDNEPYSGDLADDTLYRHATRRGLAHALIELRQDLIADEAGVEAWAARLAAILTDLNRIAGRSRGPSFRLAHRAGAAYLIQTIEPRPLP